MSSLAQRRLICVVGAAASGKTVAVQQWATGQPEPVVRVPVNPGADHPRALFEAFADATAPLCTGLADALRPERQAHAASATADDPTELAGVLAGALAAAWGERADGPFTIVVDDFDAVTSTAGVAFVADLIRLYPHTVRMIVISRTAPPFALGRLDAAGGYGGLGPQALRFDGPETASMFARAGVELDGDEATSIAEACGGWAGGLRLALESALTHGVTDLVVRLESSMAAQYLAAVALEPLTPELRRTVCTLSVLGRVDRDIAAGNPGAVARLDALAERGLLVSADATGWALTALARYAVDVAMPPDAEETAAALAECVAMAVAAGRSEPAVQWATRQGDPALIRDTLAALGWPLLDAASPALGAAAERLPAPVGDPTVDGLLGSYFASLGDIPRAQTHLGDAGALPVPIAWRVAGALWAHGEATAAHRVLERVVAGADTDADTDADRAQLAAVAATLAWGRGDGPQARRSADESLALARRSGSEAALGVAWVVQALVAALEGDLHRNQRCYSTALVHATAAQDVLTQLRVRCNLGSRFTEIGRYRDAVVELGEALRLGEAAGQRTRIALARLNQGQARLGLGRIDVALQDIDAALAIWTEIESPMVSYAHQSRGEVLARRGDATRAARAFRAAIAAAEQQQDAQTLAPSLAWLARCTAAQDLAEARLLAERAMSEPAALGSVPALLAQGWIALLAGDRVAAASSAGAARDEAARRDDPSSLAQALVLDVLAGARPSAQDARLAEARALIEEVGDEIALAEVALVTADLGRDLAAQDTARARLRALGVRDSVTLVAGPLAVLDQQRRTSVSIRVLGNFGVQLGDVAVPPSAWQSRKARDLVKILVARRGRAITRSALADLLWPEATGDVSGNRLSVALSTVRAVFDPDKALPPDHVLSADRDAVRLNLSSVAVDLELYLALADAALAAPPGDPATVPALERAAAAYGGDFCEEDPYESWAEQPREETRARQQLVCRTLADLLVRDGRPDDAVPWLITLLGVDPFDEATHLRLVGTLSSAGRHGEARRSYRAYVDRMAEIDVEPEAFPQQSSRPAPPSARPARFLNSVAAS